MPFEPKDWKDEEGPKGLVDAAELIALEARLAEYTDAEAGRATTAEDLKLTKTANLADLDDAAEARNSLGLGTAATEDSGAAGEAGMVLAADDPAALTALQPVAPVTVNSTTAAESVITPVNCAAGELTIKLPAATSKYRRVVIYKADTTKNPLKVEGTIEGEANTYTLIGYGRQISLISDGAGSWKFLAQPTAQLYTQVSDFFPAKPWSAITSAEFTTAVQTCIEYAELLGNLCAVVRFPQCPIGKTVWKMTGNVKAKISQGFIWIGAGRAGEIKLETEGKYGERFPIQATTEAEQANTEKNWTYRDMWIRGPEPAKWPTSPNGEHISGYSPCYSFGFEAPGQSRFFNCQANGFYTGASMKQFYQHFDSFKTFNCLYALYRGPNDTTQPGIQGSFTTVNCELNGSWARIGIHPNHNVGGLWAEEGGANELYTLYREPPQGLQVSMTTTPILAENACVSQATGLGVIFDESQVSSPAGYYSEPGKCQLQGVVNSIFFTENRVGNVQLLTISGGTTGNYKLVIPAQLAPETGNAFAGATTANISATASNAEIQAAINTAIGEKSNAYVSTVEGKKQILITGKASLMGTTEITVTNVSLAGGTVEIGTSHIDPEMGPRVRMNTPKKVELKNATGGKFKLKITAGGETLETETIKFNASKEEIYKAIARLANITPFGIIVGATSEAGKYFLFFNGRTLKETVTVEAVTGELTGAGAEVKIENGEAATMANRTNEYAYEVGKAVFTFEDTVAEFMGGTAGYFRCSAGERIILLQGAAKAVVNANVESGAIVAYEQAALGTAKLEFFEARSQGRRFTMRKVAGEISKGNLIAQKSTGQEGEIFPAMVKKGALVNKIPVGYAFAAIAAAKTKFIPVLKEMDSNAAAFKMLCKGEVAAGEQVKPSETEVGKVEKTTEAADFVVGRALAAASAGSVQARPVGCV